MSLPGDQPDGIRFAIADIHLALPINENTVRPSCGAGQSRAVPAVAALASPQHGLDHAAVEVHAAHGV